ALHTFDLRAIRKGLKELGLDWDAPELPPPSRVPSPAPLKVRVDPGHPTASSNAVAVGMFFERDALPTELRGVPEETEAQARLAANRAAVGVEAGDWGTAIAEYAGVLDLLPGWAEVRNLLAWHLATCPEPEFRDPARSVVNARRAAAERPENDNIRNTLGVALYRNGDYQQAVAQLLKSEEVGQGKRTAFNGLFLAMAYAKLGQREEARTWFARATRWLEEHRGEWQDNPRRAEEFSRFRREAEEFVGE